MLGDAVHPAVGVGYVAVLYVGEALVYAFGDGGGR